MMLTLKTTLIEMFRLNLNMIFTNENYGKYNKDFSKRNAETMEVENPFSIPLITLKKPL